MQKIHKISAALVVMVLCLLGIIGVSAYVFQEQPPVEIPQQVALAQSQPTILTESQAVTIATKQVNGNVQSVEFEEDEYSVTLQTDTSTYEVDIDAVTGEVLEVEQEDSVDLSEFASVQGITQEQAKTIALDRLGSGKVTEVETDMEQGRFVFEVEIEKGSKEYEVLVDAETGEILDVEEDD